MPVTTNDRPLAAVREEAIDQLIMNYGHGKLSLEAFERRLDKALDADSHETIASLTADLELIADKAYTEKKKVELGMAPAIDGSGSRDSDWLVHVFSGTNRGGHWHVPRVLRMLNVFGGTELDFSEATFSARETRINTLCLFGGATILVNENTNVVSRALCIFGGVDNKAASSPEPGTPMIVIEGLCLFGGISVKIKRTLRERWLAFAANIRGMMAPTNTR